MLPIDNGPPLYEIVLICAGAWSVLVSHWAAGQAGKRLARRRARTNHLDGAAPAEASRVESPGG